MDDPRIRHMEMYGTPPGYKEPRYMGDDSRYVEMYSGDEIYEINEECFVKEELSLDAQEVLEILGASKTQI